MNKLRRQNSVANSGFLTSNQIYMYMYIFAGSVLRYILKMTAKLPVVTGQLLWSWTSESCWENVVCVISVVAI